MIVSKTTTVAIGAVLNTLGLGLLDQARAAAVIKPRFMTEDQAESFYIDVHDMPDLVKAVAIPKEKGKCNLLLQYLDLEGHLFPDDFSPVEKEVSEKSLLCAVVTLTQVILFVFFSRHLLCLAPALFMRSQHAMVFNLPLPT